MGKTFQVLRDTTAFIFCLGLVSYGAAYLVDSRLCQKFGIPLDLVSVGLDEIYLLSRTFLVLFFLVVTGALILFSVYIVLRFVLIPAADKASWRLKPRDLPPRWRSWQGLLRNTLSEVKLGFFEEFRRMTRAIDQDTSFLEPVHRAVSFIGAFVLVWALWIFLAVEDGALDGSLLSYRHRQTSFKDCVPVKKYRDTFVCLEFQERQGRVVAQRELRLVPAGELRLFYDGRPLQPPEITVPDLLKKALDFSL